MSNVSFILTDGTTVPAQMQADSVILDKTNTSETIESMGAYYANQESSYSYQLTYTMEDGSTQTTKVQTVTTPDVVIPAPTQVTSQVIKFTIVNAVSCDADINNGFIEVDLTLNDGTLITLTPDAPSASAKLAGTMSYSGSIIYCDGSQGTIPDTPISGATVLIDLSKFKSG